MKLIASHQAGLHLGDQNFTPEFENQNRRLFTRALLEDVRALEAMLGQDSFETKKRRIGAEQEFFLVDRETWDPALVGTEALKHLDTATFTHELGKFNLEANSEPLLFGGKCLSELERQLVGFVAEARRAANLCGAEPVLTGILPTLKKADLTIESMTPIPRYYALNQALNKLRGSDYEFSITGIDELSITHDSVMVEACNTSFQVHFQVDPEEFPRFYNIAQAVSAPALAAATNSPLLFGRRLWRETRIALFMQSIDTRTATEHRRQAPPRVRFGEHWIEESVLEIFREDIARFKVLFGIDEEVEDPFEAINAGRPPKLKALQLHNSTVYRWNRACYGISEGVPHLRIEGRFFPSGPSVLDEVANAAFWFGLLSGVLEEYGDITDHLSFEQAKTNFYNAARMGLSAQFTWVDGSPVPAQDLICQRLLPLAREGLEQAKIDGNDIDRYLGIIEQRVHTGMTGAQWTLASLASFPASATESERMKALTAATVHRQLERIPVAQWDLAAIEEAGEWHENYNVVEQYMRTDLITVNKDEPIDLVANLLDWKRLRHILVEDDEYKLVGLVSERAVLRHLASQVGKEQSEPVPVSAVMAPDPVTITPKTSTLEVIKLMQRERVGCLPVVENDKLVGMVTETDFLIITRLLIEQKLSQQ